MNDSNFSQGYNSLHFSYKLPNPFVFNRKDLFMLSITYWQAREVYAESGIRGFWKGIIPTLIMVNFCLFLDNHIC